MTDVTGFRNWQRIDARTTTSGQPSEAQLAELAEMGVRHLINLALHTHDDALPDETVSVAALGMRYTHIPVVFQKPADTHFALFRAAYEATVPDPVHVHCIMNWRVSAFFCRYRRDVLGLAPADARAAMERIWQPDAVWERFIG